MRKALCVAILMIACGKAKAPASGSAAATGSAGSAGSAESVTPPPPADAAVELALDAEAAPADPKTSAVLGHYELALAWPKIKCDVVPDAKLSFDIVVDPSTGSGLGARGVPWNLEEIRDNGDAHLYLNYARQMSDTDEHVAEVVVLADVTGDTVTGTAEFKEGQISQDDTAKLCDWAKAKVTGTRKPAP
jgi:hypothetical protein